MLRRLLLAASIFCALAVPATTHAAWSTALHFPADGATQRIAADKANITPVEEGIHIQANPNGGLMMLVSVTHRIDGIRLVFPESQPVPMLFVWHRAKDPQNMFHQYLVRLQGANGEQVLIPVSLLQGWDPWADVIGFRFPSGADVTLNTLEFGGWSFPERIMNGIQSFFVTDSLFAYSINFLWGPLIVTTPVGLGQMFTSEPPLGMSVNRFFYGFLVLAALMLFGWILQGKMAGSFDRKKRAATMFFSCFLLAWLVFDARMGMEALKNFLNDITTWVMPHLGQKTFRNQQNFNDAIEQSLPVLTSVERYTVLLPDGIPIAKQVWYATYPKSRHLAATEPMSAAQAFFVFRRPDIVVDATGKLIQRKNGGAFDVLAASGSIVLRFDETSFLYKTSK